MSGNEKKLLVPRLRFPEYRAEDGWGSEFGNMIFDQISNKDHNSDLPVLAITQEQGAIPREMIDYHVSVTDKSLESYKVVEVGDFIISLRSFQGGIEFSRYRGICSPAYVILRLRHGHSEDYFRHYLKTGRFIAQMTKNLEGLRDGKMISYKQFSELELPIPQRGEQQKIADCLSSLDDLIAAETQKLDTLKTHKKGLMQQLFPREGETVPRLRFPEFREAGEWKIKSLGTVCTVLQGYGFPETLQGRTEGQYPFCKVSDISRSVAENGGFLAKAANYVNANDLATLRAKLIPIGATVFAKIGEALRLNRRAFVQCECLIDNNAVGLKAVPGVANDYFIYLLSQLINLNDHCGGAVPSVNKSTLEAIEVVVPEVDEQEKIAASMSYHDELIRNQEKKLGILKIHKAGLMQQLFPVLNGEQA